MGENSGERRADATPTTVTSWRRRLWSAATRLWTPATRYGLRWRMTATGTRWGRRADPRSATAGL